MEQAPGHKWKRKEKAFDVCYDGMLTMVMIISWCQHITNVAL